MTIPAYKDPNHPGNSSKYKTGKKCIDCNKEAGTQWSELWCFECNVKRIDKINKRLDNIVKGVK